MAIFVDTRVSILKAEIAEIEILEAADARLHDYALGSIHALTWVLKGGKPPSDMITAMSEGQREPDRRSGPDSQASV